MHRHYVSDTNLRLVKFCFVKFIWLIKNTYGIKGDLKLDGIETKHLTNIIENRFDLCQNNKLKQVRHREQPKQPLI